MDLSAYVATYLEELQGALALLDQEAIARVAEVLLEAWREGRQVFIMGNGGSAALASHMANDLSKLTISPGQPRMKVVALTDNVPLLTAWANDEGYDRVFVEPLLGFLQPGDVVLAISCSGNSRNVITAVEWAREQGARILAFTGDQGGALAPLADVVVYAPIEAIYQQEDIHLIFNHIIASAIQQHIRQVARRMDRPPRSLILAAGEGTRLRPLTLDRPKPMVPIGQRPLLDHTVRWLRQHGIHDIAINLHYKPQVILDYFGDGSAWDVRIWYAHEETLLGTAGALKNLDGFHADGPVVVVYGDVLTDLDLDALLAYHHHNVVRDPNTGVTLSLYHVPNPTEVGLVDMDAQGRITRFVEKPRPEEVFTDLANAGVLVVEPAVLEHIPPGEFFDFGLHLFPRLLEAGVSIYGWVIPRSAYLLDIGTPEKYEQARREWPVRERSLAWA